MNKETEDKRAKDSDAPGAIVQIPGVNYFVHEDPNAIREKIATARLGTSEYDDGMIQLVGLDVTSDGEGGEVTVTPYDLSVQPMHIISFRGLTEVMWQAETDKFKQQQAANPNVRAAFVPPGNIGDIMKLIFGENPEASSPPMPIEDRAGQPMLSVKAEADAKCCCGHVVAEHDTTTEFVGACSIEGCRCTLFHQHKES